MQTLRELASHRVDLSVHAARRPGRLELECIAIAEATAEVPGECRVFR